MSKAITFSRISLFVVYFWFGVLKVLGLSPASPMVLSLLKKTITFIDAPTFLIVFGLFEVLIGILFLIPKLEKIALFLLTLHMVAVCLPLVMLPDLTWKSMLVPTMEGQYIIKNILIIAIAVNLVAHRRC